MQRDLAEESMETRKMEHKSPRGLVTVGTLLGLVAIAAGSTSLTVWAMKAGGPAKTTVEQAEKDRDQARMAAEEAKKHTEEALLAAAKAVKERDEAQAAQKALEGSEAINKTVLGFLQNNVLAPDARQFWVNDSGNKDVKLRQAVDAAEPKVAKMFADKPLVEASIREVLGLTYLRLGEAKKAVSQLEQAFSKRKNELGIDDPATGECRNYLERAYRDANRPDDASRLNKNEPNENEHKTPQEKKKPARGKGSTSQGFE